MLSIGITIKCVADVGEDLLGMCQRNITLNEHMIERAGEEFAKSQITYGGLNSEMKYCGCSSISVSM